MARVASELEKIEFAENPEPRCPCVLLLDTSGSMDGEPIQALNEGVRTFKEALMEDSIAARRVEVAIITFGDSVEVVQDFVTAEQFEPPVLSASGLTPMGKAMDKALDMIEARKETYKRNSISYFRPWIFMITDGEPQPASELEPFRKAAQRMKEADEGKHVLFFAVGVEGANIELLRKATVEGRPPVSLRGLNFKEMFRWLSRSTQAVSRSRVGEQVALPPMEGWAKIET